MSNERNISRYGLTVTGIGQVLGNPFPIRFGGEPFPELGQMGLTLGLVPVRSEFATFARELTAALE